MVFDNLADSWGFLGLPVHVPRPALMEPPEPSFNFQQIYWLPEALAIHNRLLDLGPRVWGPAAVAKPLQFQPKGGSQEPKKSKERKINK